MDKKIYILLLVVVGLMLFNLYTMNQVKTDIDSYNEKIDMIAEEIDSVQELNKELDGRISSLHSEIEMIDGDITRVQNNITTIRENTDEKIVIKLFVPPTVCKPRLALEIAQGNSEGCCGSPSSKMIGLEQAARKCC